MSKLNMKKVAVAVACLLLIAAPASVAQSTVFGTTFCRDGQVVGLVVKITTPGTYTFRFNDNSCRGRTEASA